MENLIIIGMVIYWIFGYIWWRKYVYKKVKGYNSDIWEAILLWCAFLGGVFIFLHDYIKNK